MTNFIFIIKSNTTFELWQVPDDMCRQRFICEVASSPKTYSPLYGIFKKQLR